MLLQMGQPLFYIYVFSKLSLSLVSCHIDLITILPPFVFDAFASAILTGRRIELAQSTRSFKKWYSTRRGVPKQGEGIVTYVEPLRGCRNEVICRLLDEHTIPIQKNLPFPQSCFTNARKDGKMYILKMHKNKKKICQIKGESPWVF